MRAPSLLRSAWAVVLLGLFQGATSAQCPNRGSVVVEEVSNTLGKPYEAREITTIVNFAKDGGQTSCVDEGKPFSRLQRTPTRGAIVRWGPPPSEEIPVEILIDDNCGTSVSLLPGPKTAKVGKIASPQRVSERPCGREVDLKNPLGTGPEGKFEDPGHKVVDRIEVRGAR